MARQYSHSATQVGNTFDILGAEAILPTRAPPRPATRSLEFTAQQRCSVEPAGLALRGPPERRCFLQQWIGPGIHTNNRQHYQSPQFAGVVYRRRQPRRRRNGRIVCRIAETVSTVGSRPGGKRTFFRKHGYPCRFIESIKSRQLDLLENQIGDTGLAALAASSNLQNLKILNLANNDIGPDGLLSLCGSAVLANLQQLYLALNYCGDEGARALAASKALTGITELNLSEKQLSEDAIKAIVASQNFDQLTMLLLAYNEFGAQGAEEIATSKHFDRLQILDLSGNMIGAKGALSILTSKQLRRRQEIMEPEGHGNPMETMLSYMEVRGNRPRTHRGDSLTLS